MSNGYSVDDLLDFLDHAGTRGLMPPATTTALSVACRNVFAVLTEDEKANIKQLDLDAIVKRFHNKRARDFSSDTLAEYGRRVKRAVSLLLEWKENPAGFRPATRATRGKKRKDESNEEAVNDTGTVATSSVRPGTFQTTVPLGPNRFVTLTNVPLDLTTAEAERLATFVKLLPTTS